MHLTWAYIPEEVITTTDAYAQPLWSWPHVLKIGTMNRTQKVSIMPYMYLGTGLEDDICYA
jgi:hypothetical protein